MPRRYSLRVRDFPPLRRGRWYPVRVEDVAALGRAALRILLVHVASAQCGRTHTVELALPVRPAGLLARFFAAAGQSVEVDGAIDPKAAVGRTIAARFEQLPGAGNWAVVDFAPAMEQPRDDTKARDAKPQ